MPRILDLGAVPGLGRRRVRAFVPGGGPRPVLVLFDGQNIFGDEGSYAGGWHAHTAVAALGERTFHRPIVLAVDHGGARRLAELAGTELADRVAEHLVPFARARFDVTWAAIGGSSMGGLAALRAWVRRPDAFRSAIVMSPSLWVGHHALMRGFEQAPLPAEGRLYVDAGARERGRMYADAANLCALLHARGLGPERLMWRPDQRGGHNERAWRRRLPKALRFIFRRA